MTADPTRRPAAPLVARKLSKAGRVIEGLTIVEASPAARRVPLEELEAAGLLEIREGAGSGAGDSEDASQGSWSDVLEP